MATRFARSIGTRYDDTRLVAVAEATGTTVAALSRLAFTQLGRSAHLLTYRDCFLLASHLATTEGSDAASRVFDDLSDLFEDLVPSATSSDGAVKALSVPPDDHATGLAGLLWVALGDVTIRTRWQAAHAVLLLVRLGCRDELDALRRYADATETAAPFHDARFPFYALHARLWLLLALARAASEPAADVLSGFTTWLVEIVRGPRHAANQVLARNQSGVAIQSIAFSQVNASADGSTMQWAPGRRRSAAPLTGYARPTGAQHSPRTGPHHRRRGRRRRTRPARQGDHCDTRIRTAAGPTRPATA